MRGSHSIQWVVAVGVACVLSGASAAANATLVTGISDSKDAATGDRIVTLQFSPALPLFEITSRGDGAFITCEAGPKDDAVRSAGLEATTGGGRLRLGGSGVRILSVRTSAGSLELRISEAPVSAPGDGYRIGAADLITVQVYKNADISGDYSVGPDGTISLPLVGSVAASGLSEKELAERLRQKLSDFLVDPQVSVTVKTYQSQYVYVAGAVPRAARVALKPGMSLNDIFSEAGVGLLPGQVFTVTRRGDTAPFTTLDSATTDASRSPALRDGDVITVEEPKYVYVQGEVHRQGRYPLTKGMTLLQAIAVAEGFTDWASQKELKILREVDGKKKEIEVNLRKVESRKEDDPLLQPGDYILVKRRIL
jgi:protein involved in polysaccharide export with SLBB domain